MSRGHHRSLARAGHQVVIYDRRAEAGGVFARYAALHLRRQAVLVKGMGESSTYLAGRIAPSLAA